MITVLPVGAKVEDMTISEINKRLTMDVKTMFYQSAYINQNTDNIPLRTKTKKPSKHNPDKYNSDNHGLNVPK